MAIIVSKHTDPNSVGERQQVEMGVLLKLIDAILFVFFIMMATAPIVDWQLIMPQSFFPKWMVEYKNWYIGEFGDILYVEKPHFFIGQLWLELVFQWPLCLANLYGMLAGKSWYTTTCLVYGTTILTATVKLICLSLYALKLTDSFTPKK